MVLKYKSIKFFIMKNALTLIALALLCFSFTANNNDGNEPVSGTNVLILQGDIEVDEKIDIMVFEFNYFSCKWEHKEQLSEKKDYHLILDPTKNYQVWFKKKSGQTKILYVTKGEQCAIRVKMNVDFTNNLQFASLYQQDIATFITYKLQIESQAFAEDFVYLSE